MLNETPNSSSNIKRSAREKKMIKAIGTRLRDARKRRALAQVDIAEVCQTSVAAISQWERGTSLAQREKLALAANRLGIELDWLLTGNGEKAPELPESYDPAKARQNRRARRGIDISPETLPALLATELRVDPASLRAFLVTNNNFAPAIRRGSLLFVDLTKTTAVDGGIFAIDDRESIVLKKFHDGSKNKRVIRVGTRPMKGKVIGQAVAYFSVL